MSDYSWILSAARQECRELRAENAYLRARVEKAERDARIALDRLQILGVQKTVAERERDEAMAERDSGRRAAAEAAAYLRAIFGDAGLDAYQNEVIGRLEDFARESGGEGE